MTDSNVPPRSAPTAAEAKETERRLFEGLARVKIFPMDPSGPGQSPGQMLPVSSFLRKEADQPAPRPEFVGPIEHRPVSGRDSAHSWRRHCLSSPAPKR